MYTKHYILNNKDMEEVKKIEDIDLRQKCLSVCFLEEDIIKDMEQIEKIEEKSEMFWQKYKLDLYLYNKRNNITSSDSLKEVLSLHPVHFLLD